MHKNGPYEKREGRWHDSGGLLRLFMMTVMAILLVLVLSMIISATPTLSLTLLPTAVDIPTVTANNQWTPLFQDFGGVTMAQVPPGCFMIGTSDTDIAAFVKEKYGGTAADYSQETPQIRICFDKQFWIDKTDVTQAQFKQFGGQAAGKPAFPNANFPMNNITWFEARDFCEKQRQARLPTEAEWEYAARGPDDLIYPWGNMPGTDAVVRPGEGNVGISPTGASWVGVLDMSGNVWQWVSTLYMPYPYVPNDGRERDSNTNDMRVLRGISLYPGQGQFILRSASRLGFEAAIRSVDLGFRCARS